MRTNNALIPRRPRTIVFLLAACVAAFGLAACGPTVVGGQVTAAGSGAPLAGVSVQAFSTTSESVVAEVVTAADGTYRFGPEALPDGTYRLRFGRASWHGGSDWASADDVGGSAQTPIAIDHSFTQLTGSISGTATVQPDPESIGIFEVDVRNVRSGWSKKVTSPAETTSSLPWTYHVDGLPAGDYTVRVEYDRYVGDNWTSNRAWSFAPAADVPSDASIITVGPGGQVTGVDVAISSDTFDLQVSIQDGWSVALQGIYVLDEDGEFMVPLVGTPNDSRYRGLPRIPFRLLVVSANQAFAPYIVGATAENPLGTLHPADTSAITITVPD